MRQAQTTEDIKIGDHVIVQTESVRFLGKVTAVTVTDPPHNKHRARVFDVDRGEDSLLWYDVEYIWTDLDSDEERQRLHDGSTVIMGPVDKVVFGDAGAGEQEPTGAGPAAKLLEESLDILVERGKRYDNERGSPSITTTARLWDAYLHAFAQKGGELTEVEVCEMIALHKIARRLQDRAGRDHHPDMINYLALAGAYAREDSDEALP